MKYIGIIFGLIPFFAISQAYGKDLNLDRAYQNLLRESEQAYRQFANQAKQLCQEVSSDCRETVKKQKDLSVQNDIPLYILKGYHVERYGVLEADTRFAILGSRRKYYKIRVTGEKPRHLLLAKEEVDSLLFSSCDQQLVRCQHPDAAK